MTNIGAGSGPRSSSLELRPPGIMFGFSLRPLRLPAVNSRRREGCGESLVLSVLRRTKPAAALRVGAVIPLAPRQIKCHTMQSNFTRKSLKTNDGHPKEVTHKSEVQCTGFSAVWMRRRREFSTFDFWFSNPLPESRRSRPASDSLSGGII